MQQHTQLTAVRRILQQLHELAGAGFSDKLEPVGNIDGSKRAKLRSSGSRLPIQCADLLPNGALSERPLGGHKTDAERHDDHEEIPGSPHLAS